MSVGPAQCAWSESSGSASSGNELPEPHLSAPRFPTVSVEGFLKDYERAIRATLAASCPPWLRNEVDDLAQEVRLRLWRRLSDEPGRELNGAYVRRVATTTLIDAVRRGQARHRDQAMLDVDDAAIADASTQTHAAQRLEIGEAIEQCLDALQDDARLAVRLKLQGFNHAEVATLCEWKEARARNLMYRGLTRLRECLLGRGIRTSLGEPELGGSA